jgi:polyphosphate kinase 2 (PPK2 family)
MTEHSFKVPSGEELEHDYLWRYSRRLPAREEIGIFNRSHYEEVLAVRLHPEYLDRQETLTHTSTDWAAWHVIPADRKWFARIATAAVLVDALIELDPRYPQVDAEQRSALQTVKGQLEAEAPEGAAADPNRD